MLLSPDFESYLTHGQLHLLVLTCEVVGANHLSYEEDQTKQDCSKSSHHLEAPSQHVLASHQTHSTCLSLLLPSLMGALPPKLPCFRSHSERLLLSYLFSQKSHKILETKMLFNTNHQEFTRPATKSQPVT